MSGLLYYLVLFAALFFSVAGLTVLAILFWSCWEFRRNVDKIVERRRFDRYY